MENTSKAGIRKSKKLSVGRKSCPNDSPKTPIRNTRSPDILFIESPYNTPCNSNNPTYFAEESPSQDFDLSPIISTQEVKYSETDVDWKWDDQPSSNLIIKKPKILYKFKRLQEKKSKYKKKTPDIDKKKGFFKFQEELLKNIKNEASNINIKQELDSSLKENQNESLQDTLKSKQSIQLEKNNENQKNNIKSCSNNLMDDSDLDNLLLQCSQEVESIYNKKKSPEKAINDSKNNLNNCFENNKQLESISINDLKKDAFEDSIDEILSSIPVDGNILCKNQVSSELGIKFSRHNSMPVYSPKLKQSNKPTNSFTRYNSMSSLDLPNDSSCIPGSQDSDQKRCSAEEIKRKRLEALQRRKARLQKK